MDPSNKDDLRRLFMELLDGKLTADETSLLADTLREDAGARAAYHDLIETHALLHWEHGQPDELRMIDSFDQTLADRRAMPSTEAVLASWGGDKEDKLSGQPQERASTPVLGFLGECLQQGMSFLSKSNVLFAILVAVGLPGLILLILVVSLTDQRPRKPLGPVATIARTCDCVGSLDSGCTPLLAGTGLFQGQRLTLQRGLVEIAFAKGATVFLEAPTVFEVRHGHGGLLQRGRLAANVSAQARGFTVETPLATVVDLGTEFGVLVTADGTSEAHVFKGQVEMAARPTSANPDPSMNLLHVGQAARVRLTSGQQASVELFAASAEQFVRRLPSAESVKPAAIIADFSGGNGNAQADQFPGTAGEGWASGWQYQEPAGIKCTASVNRDDSAFGDGEYLRVLAERESGTNHATGTLERRLDLTNPVDLTKPHRVSLVFRVDTLGGFDQPNDQIILCNNQYSLPATRDFASSGWHVRFDSASHKGVRARHWSFISGDGKGEETWIDSGIAVVEGDVYSIRILVDPPARQWTPSIAVNGGPWTTFKPMGMRSRGTAAEREYWPYLYLYWMLAGGNKGEGREKVGFSVDSIRITAAD